MTLVSEAGPLSDLGERLVGPSHQGLRPLRSALEDVSLGTDTNCLLKGATEVIGAETCHSSQIDQDQSIIQMGLDVIPHPLQAFAGKPVRRLEHKRRLIGNTAHNLHRECRIQCVGEDTIDETTIDLMGDRRSHLGNQWIDERILRLDIDGPPAHQFGGQIVVDVTIRSAKSDDLGRDRTRRRTLGQFRLFSGLTSLEPPAIGADG